MSQRTLPPLFAIDAKNKERVWKCWVIKNVVYREYGLVDGKKTNSNRVFEGKSIGKKNETTPENQAWAEANKEWVKHIDKEYKPRSNDTEGIILMKRVVEEKSKTGGHNINAGAALGSREVKNITESKTKKYIVSVNDDYKSVIPMKAHTWELKDEQDPYSVHPKVSKYFSKNPAFYGQPKLDGWRAIINIVGSDVIITSNSGKQYPWFSTLRTCIKEWLKGVEDQILDGLDGELYATQIKDERGNIISDEARFSTICSMCGLARSEPHILENQIQYHIFDLVDKSGKISQTERFKKLDALFGRFKNSSEFSKSGKFSRLVQVPVKIIKSVNEVPKFHNEFSMLGYEGVVLRTFENYYKPGKRSNEMRKYKHFIDNEYEITGCKLDKGVDKEHFVWVLKTENGDEFSAKPKGTREEKNDWYDNSKKYIGKWMTVKFQEYSDDKIPRFPIAKEFRTGRGKD